MKLRVAFQPNKTYTSMKDIGRYNVSEEKLVKLLFDVILDLPAHSKLTMPDLEKLIGNIVEDEMTAVGYKTDNTLNQSCVTLVTAVDFKDKIYTLKHMKYGIDIYDPVSRD